MAEEHEIRYRNTKNHTDPVNSSITRPKSTISSLISTIIPTDDSKKKYFTSTRFRGLGCTAPAQVSVPAMIKTSANWEGKRVRKKKLKLKKNKNCIDNNTQGDGVNLVISNPSSCLVVPDVWCGFSTDAASVDCVVSTIPGRGRLDGEKINLRERGGRRMVYPEDVPFFDADSHHHHHHHVIGSRHHRHVRHPYPQGLAEIVLLQGNLVMGGRLDHDRYRDWRLDVDTMSYEELLELGDKIGHVSTGLREDEIQKCVRKTKPSSSKQWKCTICQEENEGEDEIGKLECGHFYHMQCIKQWLVQKKTCPICKVGVKSLN